MVSIRGLSRITENCVGIELNRAMREQAQVFHAAVVLIEDKASGTQLIQELIADGLHAVTRYRPRSDKIMRLHAQTAMIENGFVHLPERAPWLAPYLAELTAFPNARHDDQVELNRADARLVQGRRPRAGHPRLLPNARSGASPAGIFGHSLKRHETLPRMLLKASAKRRDCDWGAAKCGSGRSWTQNRRSVPNFR